MLYQLTLRPVQRAADWFDKQYDFPAGSGMQIIKYLLWSKQISISDTSSAVLEVRYDKHK